MKGNLARKFCEKHQDSIICEPSGRTLKELREETVQRIIIVQDSKDLKKEIKALEKEKKKRGKEK